MGEAVRRKAIDDAEDIAEIVIEERSHDALRQGVADIAHTVANFLPDVSDVFGRESAVKVDIDRNDARPCDRSQRIEPGRFLEPALKPVGQLVLRLVHAGAGPDGGDQHRLDREGGVFIAAEADEGKDAGNDCNQHQIDRERARPDRPFRKVWPDHDRPTGSRTSWPGRRA